MNYAKLCLNFRLLVAGRRISHVKHGEGIFIDFDMVAMEDMDEVVGMAHTLDLLSYSPHDEKCTLGLLTGCTS